MKNYLFIIFILLSIECKQQKDTETSLTSQKNNTKTYNSTNCQIQTENQNIILDCNGKKTVYNNLIINEMSISTDLIQEKGNHFSIVYELNASATKVKEKYNFIYSNEGIFLICKEVLKYGGDGIMSNRMYFDFYDIKNKSFEDLQSLGDQVKEIFTKNNLSINYMDFRREKFAEEKLNLSNEDIFISYPVLARSNIKIINVEAANNLAFSLQQKRAYDDSRLLLENIVSQYPDRVVAYLNLADTDWALGNKEQARKNYTIYVSLMKKQKKNLDKIPQRVFERTR